MAQQTNKKSERATQRRILVLAILGVIVVMSGVAYWWQKSSVGESQGKSESAATTKVNLYYYNKTKDIESSGFVSCSPDAVLPVEREIPRTDTPIEDTIRLLIQGELTEAEKASGFTTEFPHPEFKLLDVYLKDGSLMLTFTEVRGFTVGGACRVTLLAAQITKTARQFPGVRKVRLAPDSLFQP